MQRIYMDYAATTPMDRSVAALTATLMEETFGNPSGIYEESRKAKRILENARRQVAEVIGALPGEIVFTSGGTESDNWALKGMALKHFDVKGHIITTAVEHHAVLHSCDALRKMGFEITLVPVDGFGMVDPEDIRRAIRPDTRLISVMSANNEVGTIQPIAAIHGVAGDYGIPFHTDGVQAFGAIPLHVNDLGVDLLSVSSHKIYGPKGVGALYIRNGIGIDAFLHGGAQERKRRAGTENVPCIGGFGAAAALAGAHVDQQGEALTALRQHLVEGVLSTVPHARLNGHPEKRLPGNAHFVFEGIRSDALLMRLDMAGIAGSAGSACTAGSTEPSHVLRAMGIPDAFGAGALRLTLGRNTTIDEVDRVIAVLGEIIRDLRR